jgi:hypothetical protein
MRLVKSASAVEYRDAGGQDRECKAEVWGSSDGSRAVLVLREVCGPDLPQVIEGAQAALRRLQEAWLPFLVPTARLQVLVVRPRPDQKSLALALPG